MLTINLMAKVTITKEVEMFIPPCVAQEKRKEEDDE